jgi:DNA-binding SARP family transcriptional activator/class 3 adenylate cyclase/regulation of enolase protein 1 (concanavalin A-like superfamily)
MSRLTLHTLGMPRIEYAGSSLALDRRKAVALLVYLALNDRAHGRDALATLFWPGYDQATARGNLRRTLSVLHTALHEAWLVSDRDSVALRRSGELWIDTLEFERLLATCRTHGHAPAQTCPRCLPALSQAVALYADDFLTGFTLPDAPDFDDWQREQTEALRRMLSDALARLAKCLVVAGDFAGAADHVRRRVALDPLDESAQRQLMQVLAWAGDRTAALRQYQACVALLRRDVQAAPSPETTNLYAAISQNLLAPPAAFAQPGPELVSRAAELPAGEREHVLSAAPETPPAGQQIWSPDERGVSGDLRPVSVLCAGLAGEAEPEIAASGVARLLQALETVLGCYEARIDRLLGDSVVAVFGAGQVHEDDPERAVAAACALLPAALALDAQAETQACAGPGISAAVVTGEAYFGPVGAGDRAHVAVLGPLVNRAARLQTRAAAGQALADRATYSRTRGAFSFRPAGSEGAPEQPQVYEVIGVRSRPAKTRGIEGLRAALVGRDEELARLTAALTKACAGQGQMVTLIGEAGVGKSRLVAELRARHPHPVPAELAPLPRREREATPSPLGGEGRGEGHVAWLEGRCLEPASNTPYAPFADLLRSHFSALAALGDAPCDPALLACAIRGDMQALRDGGHLTSEQVEEIGPLLGNLLSVRFGDDWDERLRMADPGQIRHRTFAALRTLFAAWASRQPTVIVLEDLHWADSLTIDLIGELIGVLADQPLLVLCVFRPGREYPSERLAPMAERRCAGRYTELRLRPLTAGEGRRLLASLLTVEDLPAQARELIVAQGEGNPFFTEEIVRGLIDAGLLFRDGATWRARERIEIAHAPEGVRSVILSRVDRLAVGDRQVLQAAAVLGRLFRPRVLARLLPSEVNLDAVLDRLAERDFVYLERSWPEPEYSFKHVLTQQAVYGMLLAGRKAQLHRRAGEAIESLYADSLAEHYEALAHHYDRGDAGEKAIEYLLKAGEKARRAYLNDEAIAYFERALARCEQAASAGGPGVGCAAARLEALTGLGKVHFLVGRFVDAERWLRQAISLGRELGLASVPLVQLSFWLGDSLYWQGRQIEQGQVGEEGLALLGDATESVETATMSYFVAIGLRFAGEEEKFWERIARISQYVGDLPYREELRTVYSGVTMFEFLRNKNAEGAQRWADALEQHGRRNHDRRALCEALVDRAVIQFRSGGYESALMYDERALDECLQISDVPNGLGAYEMLCIHYLAVGRLDEAATWAYRSLEDWMGAHDAKRTPCALTTLGIVQLSNRDYTGASCTAAKIGEILPALSFQRRLQLTLTLAGLNLALARDAEVLTLFRILLHDIPPAVLCPWFRRAQLRPWFPALLSSIEAACGNPAAFRAFCGDYRERHPEAATLAPYQWYLEPAVAPHSFADPRYGLDLGKATAGDLQYAGWRWFDPHSDCSYLVLPANGLVMCAANGRDLFYTNQSAPRFVRQASGDFAAETVCLTADDRPAMGGLLLWLDKENYLRVEWGRYGRYEVLFDGCVANADAVYGRGRLPREPLRVFLRLVRRGDRMDALCSADGETWWSVGHAAFPTEDPVQIGLCAIGMIDRTIYPGAYRDGTAIRFESFRMW